MTSERICLDRAALAALKADGLGWGHDLDCGCLRVPAAPRPARLARWFRVGGRAYG